MPNPDADQRIVTFNRSDEAITGLPVQSVLEHLIAEVPRLPHCVGIPTVELRRLFQPFQSTSANAAARPGDRFTDRDRRPRREQRQLEAGSRHDVTVRLPAHAAVTT